MKKKQKTISTDSRKAAIHLYAAITECNLPLSGLTNETNGASYYLKLSAKDRNLTKAILTCTLKYKPYIEKLLSSYLKKKLPQGAKTLRHILHTTIAQIIYMNIPSYAAINSAVSIAKYDSRTKRFAQLINAILREIDRDLTKGAIQNRIQMHPLDTVPTWFRDLIVKDYSEEKATNIIKAHLNENAIDLTVKTDPIKWAKKLNALPIWGNSIRLPKSYKGSISDLEGYQEGQWWVQDCAANIPITILGNITGLTAIDLCAAPGGKTAQLAANGAITTCCEINNNRLQRLKQNMERLNLSVETMLGDFSKLEHSTYDIVLLDAPCSSTGTIRKNSDILWSKTEKDIFDLADVQYNMLVKAIEYAKPNGTILFSNCSINKAEGEEVIQKLLNNISNVELLPFCKKETTFLANPQLASFITNEGYLRTTPDSFYIGDNVNYADTMDGFFVARLKKLA